MSHSLPSPHFPLCTGSHQIEQSSKTRRSRPPKPTIVDFVSSHGLEDLRADRFAAPEEADSLYSFPRESNKELIRPSNLVYGSSLPSLLRRVGIHYIPFGACTTFTSLLRVAFLAATALGSIFIKCINTPDLEWAVPKMGQGFLSDFLWIIIPVSFFAEQFELHVT
ncbi:hypothetical protein C8R44DRAFT_754216 [Mycena epipterygia]|nr:hypothetical protein C8R44DRAFT_754216 [Mycena epipterygia]